MVLLTDGWDTGSDHGVSDAIEACQGADTMVHSIRYVDPAWLRPNTDEKTSPSRQRATQRHLEHIYLKAQCDSLSTVLSTIETALRSEYVLAYEEEKPRPGYHTIRVQVRRPGMSAGARAGFYAQ